MKLGAYSPEIAAGTAAELFRKARAYGFSLMQFNYASVLGEEMPAVIPDSLNREIAGAAAENGIEIVAVNGTFNMAHPDREVRLDGVTRFETIAASSRALGAGLISLCTGTRTREYMWRPHPDNSGREAWRDMTAVMERLILIAEKYDVYLGIETEASNIVNTPEKARKLLEELGSSRLKIILDAANLFRPGMARRENVREVIARAFDLLGPWIALAHGKDIMEGEGIAFTSPGKGIVDFDFFFSRLEKGAYNNGLILHGIKDERDMPFSVDYIRRTAAGRAGTAR